MGVIAFHTDTAACIYGCWNDELEAVSFCETTIISGAAMRMISSDIGIKYSRLLIKAIHFKSLIANPSRQVSCHIFEANLALTSL